MITWAVDGVFLSRGDLTRWHLAGMTVRSACYRGNAFEGIEPGKNGVLSEKNASIPSDAREYNSEKSYERFPVLQFIEFALGKT